MEIGAIVVIIASIIILILFLLGFKKMKHKLTAFILIALILFGFFSFNIVFKGKDIPLKTSTDLENIIRTYFSWLGTLFGNLKVITTQAIKMDWKGNSTT